MNTTMARIGKEKRLVAFAVYTLLRDHPGQTPAEIAAACGQGERWARGILALLREQGLVNTQPHGHTARYYLAESGRDGANRHKVASVGEELPTDETPSGELVPAGELAPTWRETLAAVLLSMSPDAFERLCMRLLRESGFDEVTVTNSSGDGGIDGRGIKRLDGLISFPILFQCKRYANNVSAGTVRDFRGAMAGRADRGLILTTGGFTSDAQKEATRDGVPPIDLIDGELLMERLKELGLGVSVRTVEVVEVDKGFFDSI